CVEGRRPRWVRRVDPYEDGATARRAKRGGDCPPCQEKCISRKSLIMALQWTKTLLLGPDDVPPSRSDWEVIGVFNPGVAVVDGLVMLLVRVAERPRETQPGYVALPRWDAEHGYVVDWVDESDLEPVDSRVV